MKKSAKTSPAKPSTRSRPAQPPPKTRGATRGAATKKRPPRRSAAGPASSVEAGQRYGTSSVAELQLRELEALRQEIEQRKADLERGLPRWNADPEDVQKSVAQLVLALVEFLRKLLERQAIRRMESDSLSSEETEKIGLALMRLEETVHDLAGRFGLSPDELNLDLGPIGRLI